MLYAVSVETSRAIRHGRMRRRERVYVDARDDEEARSLALQRFRHLRRAGRAWARDPMRIDVADVRRVDLEKTRPAPAPVKTSAPAAGKPSVPNPKNPRRPKKRRPRKTGASKR